METEVRAPILAFASGIALTASAQAAPLALQPAAMELTRHHPPSSCPEGAGGGGTGTIGKIAGETCVGVAALRIGGGDPAPAAKSTRSFSRTILAG